MILFWGSMRPLHQGGARYEITHRRAALAVVTLLVFATTPFTVSAQEQESTDSDVTIEEIVVSGAAIKHLDLNTVSKTGSRLGLSAMETPASVEVIGFETMSARGLKSITEAAESFVGVNSGDDPGSPSSFSVRGFTDSQITNLRDGIRNGPASNVMRPQNTFNLERVEILKGPASVLYGQGAVAGTVNSVTKKPVIGKEVGGEMLLSYGRYNTLEVGVGVGGPIGENLAYRMDFSRHSTDGWIKNAASHSNNFTASLLWEPLDTVHVLFSADYLEDELPPDWGTPLVPPSFATQPISGVVETADGWVLDERMRFTSYDVADHEMPSDQLWTRASVDWHVNDGLTITGDAYNYTADRTWRISDYYSFLPATGVIERDRFVAHHDHSLFGGQVQLKYDHLIYGKNNTVVVGTSYSDNDFYRPTAFVFGVDEVDPLNPMVGEFGSLLPTEAGNTRIKTAAFFVEDVLEIVDGLKLVAGLNYESNEVNGKDFDMAGNQVFEETFELNNFSWRIGAVYEFAPSFVAYGQLSTGQDAPNGFGLLTRLATDVDLTDVFQWEVGVKATELVDGRAEFTAAYYSIERKNFLIPTEALVTELSTVGEQRSQGVELAASIDLTDRWSMSANVAYTDAEYVNFIDSNGFNRSGNRPHNVAPWIANLWASVSDVAGLPLEIGGGLRYVSDRFSDFANTLELKSHTVGNVYAAYTHGNTRVMLRVKNVFDDTYSSWTSPFYRQIMLASPRAAELSVSRKF